MSKIDDGFFSWLVSMANFHGKLQMPMMKEPSKLISPKNLIPFSKSSYSENKEEFVHFYEYDIMFRKLLLNPEKFIQKLYPFPGVITPDCSLYRDMPIIPQMANTYMNRAIGCYLQENGVYTIPNIRWGDEESYKETSYGDIPFAFMGVPKYSIVSISTYGCIRGNENKWHFKAGLQSMIKYLEPAKVLVHGAMPAEVFEDVMLQTEFHQYADWITQKRKKGC